ncbi:prefoldin subunit 3-like [Ptychodera flava]|uniref:prefoldin subunit 3-like n=1 Tax=Ptychodera flava TaxID=63121 RepID=UPI003969D311
MAEDQKEHGGIPRATFVEDVDKFMAETHNESAEKVLQEMDEQHQKYKFMELNLAHRKKRLLTQLPDTKSTLDIVKLLQSKQNTTEPIQTHFLLAEQVYGKAAIDPTDKVCLWLGANVMLEYDLEEARKLLESNLEAAKKTLKIVDGDLDFLKDQYTTTEVNMARIYNWDVKRRQSLAAKGST